ncbi:hypothetical protein RDMS_01465 [Deinococcus sp. RL]|uniref:hypothetical protein n=1 Tax=Deinococcus sp. RL TaxID=1489678 RepID=UPI0004D8071A|nr:hypothetical protein [Deinococcus sp. RL]KEF35450.1 hypothetical protein RDMS_01465 [Deinococcus sp. RL]
MPHIPLTDWAAARNHSPTLARRWAAAGRLATAVKRGRDWHVAPDDEPTPGQRGPKLALPPVPDLSTSQAPNMDRPTERRIEAALDGRVELARAQVRAAEKVLREAQAALETARDSLREAERSREALLRDLGIEV